MYAGNVITPDFMAARAWNVAATAAATNSATVASKAAAAGKQWVMTGWEALYNATNFTGVLTIYKGTDAVRYFQIDTTAGASGTQKASWEEGDWLVGDENELVSASLAASATTAVVGYVSIHGFHLGVRN